jgi:hypothetical protein
MKTKLFGGIAALAIAATIALNMSLNANSNNLSDLSLANVEALAEPEGGIDIPCFCALTEWKLCCYFPADQITLMGDNLLTGPIVGK